MPLRRTPLQGLVVVAAVASWCPLMPVEAAKLWSDPATIWEAADAGDHEEVQRLMESGESVNQASLSHGLMPLHLAARNGHFQASWLMLSTPWNATDDFAPIHLQHSATGQDGTGSDALPGASGDGGGGAAAAAAAADGATVPPAIFVGPRANINARSVAVQDAYSNTHRNKYIGVPGQTPLHLAALHGHTNIVSLLLKNISGQIASVNATTDFSVNAEAGAGETALHYAARSGDEVVCRLLVAAGSIVDARSDLDWTPFMFAAKLGHSNLLKYFADIGADIHHAPENGLPLLTIAHRSVRAQIQKLFSAHRDL